MPQASSNFHLQIDTCLSDCSDGVLAVSSDGVLAVSSDGVLAVAAGASLFSDNSMHPAKDSTACN